MPIRLCFRDPIPEIFEASRNLNEAVSAYMVGHVGEAESLIRLANMPIIREWTESIWGKNSPFVQSYAVANSKMEDVTREKMRMPSTIEKNALHARDGYHC